MAIGVGNVAGAVTNITTALYSPSSLKSFLTGINLLGIQVKNNFEINFSGIPGFTFFATTINIPGMRQNFTELHYDGKKIDIPINYDYDHEFSLTLVNDAQGLLYSLVTNFVMTDETCLMAKSSYVMTIKAMNGDDRYPGTLYTLNDVRIESVGQLQYGYSDNDISTFDINCKLQSFTATPGAASIVSNIAGTANSILG